MIGIIPAAGMAERMHRLPKMLLPIPGHVGGDLLGRLIWSMTRADVSSIHIGTSPENYSRLSAKLIGERVFVSPVATQTMSETVLLLHGFSDKPEPVLFGMPDTYFEDADAFVKLAAELDAGADVAVGVFYTRPEQRRKLGMVELAGDEVLHVIDKPAKTDLIWAWGVLAWKPRFWDLLDAADPHVGYALPRALAAGLDVRAVKMSGGYWDCGTSEEYFDLITHLHHPMRVVVTA